MERKISRGALGSPEVKEGRGDTGRVAHTQEAGCAVISQEAHMFL